MCGEGGPQGEISRCVDGQCILDEPVHQDCGGRGLARQEGEAKSHLTAITARSSMSLKTFKSSV